MKTFHYLCSCGASWEEKTDDDVEDCDDEAIADCPECGEKVEPEDDGGMWHPI